MYYERYMVSWCIVSRLWRSTIFRWSHIVGKTNPDEADVGSIRADFCTVKEYNAVHASDCPESARREMGLWFKEDEICDNYKTMLEIVMGAWILIYARDCFK